MSPQSPSSLNTFRDTHEKAIAERVRAATEFLLDEGVVPSFYSVAEAAQVARSTLYRRKDLKTLVTSAREEAEARALSSNLGTRLKELGADNSLLSEELTRLRLELAKARERAMPDYAFIVLDSNFALRPKSD